MTACSPSARRSREVYRRWGWGDRVFVWHEAADTRLFRPPVDDGPRDGLVWIGNWGDGERTAGARRIPVRAGAARRLAARRLRRALSRRGAGDAGALRRALSRLAAQRARSRGLRPPPRDRACAAPLLRRARCPAFRRSACSRRWPAAFRCCRAPWRDTEGLFRPGEDYLVARDGERDERTPARRFATTRTSQARSSQTAWRPSAPATPAPIAPTNCSRSSRRLDAAAVWRPPHEDRLLRLEPAVVLLERRRHLLSRPARGSRPARPRITFYEPDAFDRQQHRDIDPPDWAGVASMPRTTEAPALRDRRGRDRRRRGQGERRRRVRRRAARRRHRRRAARRDPDLLGRRRARDAGRNAAETRTIPFAQRCPISTWC